MPALRELFASFGVEFDKEGALQKGAANVDGLWGKLNKLGGKLAGGVIVGGFIGLTKHVIESGDQLATQAERLGVAASALQEWQYAGDLADVSAEELSAGFRILQRSVQGAASGSAEAAAGFTKLGISQDVLTGGNLDAILTQAADGFAALTNPIEKTALAMKLFGRGGAALVPLLNKGSAGVKQLKDEFHALGGGLDDETVQAANDADDAFKRLKTGLKGLIFNAVRPFILAATTIATKLKDGLVYFRELSKNSNIVSAALVFLGAVAVKAALGILVAFAPLIVTTLIWAAGIAAAILVVDELITLFQGGNTVIGEWIDKTYGVGTASKVVAAVTELWNDLTGALGGSNVAFEVVKTTVSALFTVFDKLAKSIAFVADQWHSIFTSGDADEGLKLLVRDAGRAIGIGGKSADEKKFEHGADGIGEKVVGANYGIGSGYGIFGPQAPLPTVPGAPSNTNTNNSSSVVNVSIQANAKPDAELASHVAGAVQKGLDAHARKLSASVGGA